MRAPEHPNLRDWRDEDLPAYLALHVDPDVNYWLGGTWTRQMASERFERARRPRGDGFGAWPIVDDDGLLVGVGYVTPVGEHLSLYPAVEAGWRLAPQARGRGLATSAMKPILTRGFEVGGADRILAYTARQNERSQAVMRRLGFQAAPEHDFDHPALDEGHPLRRHVVFALHKTREAAPC